MAKKYIVELEIDGVKESVQNMEQLETTVADLENQLKQADFGSDEFKKLSGELGKAKGELNQFQREIDALDPTAKAEQFVKFAEGISGGFAIATGAMAVFGGKNEELEKTMVKVQGAIAIAVGIRQIAESKLLETLARTAVGQGLLSAATATYTFVTGAASTALKVFRLALVSTGIGAIVVAVGMLVANFDKLYGALKFVAEFMVNTVVGAFNLVIDGVNWIIKQLNKIPGVSIGMIDSMEKVSFASKEAADTTSYYADELDKLKAAQEAATQAADDHMKALNRELALMEARGDSEAAILAMKREILEAAVNEAIATEVAIEQQLALAQAAMEANKALLARKAEEEGKSVDDVLADLGLANPKEIEKALNDAKNARLDAENNLAVFEAEINTKRREERKKQKEEDEAEEQKEKEEEAAKLEEKKQQMLDEAEQLKALQDELALMAVEDAFARSALELEQQMAADLAQIEQAENFEEQKLLIEEKYKKLSEDLNAEHIKFKEDQQKEADQEALDQAQTIEEAKQQIAQDGLNALSSLVDLVGGEGKRAKNIQKAIAIAQITIDTAKAISSAIAGATAAAAATGPAAPFTMVAYIASGIATVLANVVTARNILKEADSVEIPGGGGGGGGGGSGPAPTAQAQGSAPDVGGGLQNMLQGGGIDFSFLANGDTSQIGGAVPPVQAYVLESDVTTSQEAVQRIEDQATI